MRWEYRQDAPCLDTFQHEIESQAVAAGKALRESLKALERAHVKTVRLAQTAGGVSRTQWLDPGTRRGMQGGIPESDRLVCPPSCPGGRTPKLQQPGEDCFVQETVLESAGQRARPDSVCQAGGPRLQWPPSPDCISNFDTGESGHFLTSTHTWIDTPAAFRHIREHGNCSCSKHWWASSNVKDKEKRS